MNSVIIIGASGHGKVIADIIQKSGDKVLGFLDDNTKLPNTFINFPLLGTVDKYNKYITEAQFVIAVGDAIVRKMIAKKLAGVKWYTAIHPSAVISCINVAIAEGTVVMANTVINSGSVIGRHCIINSGAIVEHDNKLKDFVHVSVGAKLAGTVSVGEGSWIGIGACISNNLKICAHCTIGAGAVVINNINDAGTYIGIPAKRLERTDNMNKYIRNYIGGGVFRKSTVDIPFNYRRCAA